MYTYHIVGKLLLAPTGSPGKPGIWIPSPPPIGKIPKIIHLVQGIFFLHWKQEQLCSDVFPNFSQTKNHSFPVCSYDFPIKTSIYSGCSHIFPRFSQIFPPVPKRTGFVAPRRWIRSTSLVVVVVVRRVVRPCAPRFRHVTAREQ